MAEGDKISQLPVLTALDDPDIFVVVDVSASTTKGITRANARPYLNYLTASESGELTGAASTALHYHDTDRNYAYHTGEYIVLTGTNPRIQLTDDAYPTTSLISGNTGQITLEADNAAEEGESFISGDVDGEAVVKFNSTTTNPGLSFKHMILGEDGVDGVYWITGTGVPTVEAPIGSLFSQTDAGNNQPALFVREYNIGGTAVWIAAT